jgi:phage gp36-like protein
MSYATQSHIEAEFKDVTFSTTTAVTPTDITRFLEEADAEIDSKLSLKYATPITGTNALIIVRLIEIWLVKSRVSEILRVKTGRPESDQEGGDPGERARQWLTDLVSEKMRLTDGTRASSYDGVRSYALENSLEHVFDKDIDQW